MAVSYLSNVSAVLMTITPHVIVLVLTIVAAVRSAALPRVLLFIAVGFHAISMVSLVAYYSSIEVAYTMGGDALLGWWSAINSVFQVVAWSLVLVSIMIGRPGVSGPGTPPPPIDPYPHNPPPGLGR